MEEYRILTVSQVNAYVGSLFKGDRNLQDVYIEGEISNFKLQGSSGHMYFALKDRDSIIGAVMFSYAGRYLRFQPRDGINVIARGNITLYQKTGKYQIQVLEMMEKGAGDLAVQFEKLKLKLSNLGYFDEGHKKEIPKFPEKVGVITSPTGAAVRDIFNILERRFPGIDIHLQAASVQGESAPAELAQAVNILSDSDCDVIIIGRGGGSIEDLWAFNSEILANAIYNCKVPVISAVGHETDFTICDFVSDLRAPTPSAAAELAVPDRKELLDIISHKGSQLGIIFKEKIRAGFRAVDNYKRIIDAYSPNERIKSMHERLEASEGLLSAYSPLKKIENLSRELDELKEKLDGNMMSRISLADSSIEGYLSSLESMNPVSVLKRGYSYTTKDKRNISSVNDVETGDVVDILLHDGTIKARVEGKNI